MLENHGYLIADAAIQRHLLPSEETGDQPGLALTMRPAEVPFPEWMDERRVREALKNSDKVRVLGRW